MKLLILEDSIHRQEIFKELFKHQTLFIVDNVEDAVKTLSWNKIDMFFLDHDLDNKVYVDSNCENTGYSFVKKLVTYPEYKNTLVYVHSLNPIGANRMINYLLDNDYNGFWMPFNLIKEI